MSNSVTMVAGFVLLKSALAVVKQRRACAHAIEEGDAFCSRCGKPAMIRGEEIADLGFGRYQLFTPNTLDFENVNSSPPFVFGLELGTSWKPAASEKLAEWEQEIRDGLAERGFLHGLPAFAIHLVRTADY